MKPLFNYSRIFLLIGFTSLLSFKTTFAQNKKGKGKYTSLLWEISGNGLKKPSYLFGTMHVSSKMVFHLSDSFYHAIKDAEVVALETNPENWQDDFTNSKFINTGNGVNLRGNAGYGAGIDMPNDFLSINTFAVHKYERGIAMALSAQPEIINSLLYRNYAGAEDFEEDTFLDMYIFQAGKKLGKKVTGVENFEESEKLVMEAYKDAAKEHNTKRRSYDYNDNYSDPKKLQDAYRKGDLDMLDSLNKLNTFSDAFQEKFLYKRNDIQAASIDSIIKSGSSLFVGVGAAHLPGARGVIEWLRKHGYTMRPVLMGERDSNQKDLVDKIRIPLNFTRRWADDSAFSVELPGKLYRFTPVRYINQLQFADMINGAYYIVTRLKTNSSLWGHDVNMVNKKVDSLLYENVPGKMISKKEITVNGYKGFDITNKTRRGDYQRYNIIITPFEIFFFKMSGNGEFVTEGNEAKKFFESIQIKTSKTTEWINYQPPYGGFSISMPGQPVLNKVYSGGPNRFEYEAVDEKDGSNFLVMKTDVHNLNFIEEDTFDLNLLDESYASSPFIEKTISRKPGNYKGYPSLDVKYKHKDGSVTQARYIIQGPHYYALLAHGKKETPNHSGFLNSFTITPFIYPEVKERTDTSLYYTVSSPLLPENKGQSFMQEMMKQYEDENDDENVNANFPAAFKIITIGNDTAGEKILAMYYKMPKYKYEKDSSSFWDNGEIAMHDSDFIYRKFEKQNLPGGAINYNIQLLDTNSSRTIISKVFYRQGVVHMIAALTDTLTPPSSLLKYFFATFKPSDTIKGYSPFEKKSAIFLTDYYSTDSATKKKAIKYLSNMIFDSSDIPEIKKAIRQLSWKDKDYLKLKRDWIEHLGKMGDTTVTYYLKDLYKAAGDTVELQNTILETLLTQKTKTSYRVFKEIMLEEPPVLENNTNAGSTRRYYDIAQYKLPGSNHFYKNNLFDYLYDSAQLTKTLFPEFLALLTLDDYKPKMMDLLSNLVDSGYIKAADYQDYYNKIWLEAKQELRKQNIAEKTKAIEKKQDEMDEKKPANDVGDNDESSTGNESLDLYAVLMMPFWDKNENIPLFFNKLLQTNDKKLKYNTALLLLRNNKPVPDSIWKYFAAMDEYRSELYDDLEEVKHAEKFPAKYKTQMDLAKSVLINSRSYNKVDTIVYLDKLPVNYRDDKGWVYFYKYKDKKDDATWEFASSGIQPENIKEISTDDAFTSFMQDNLDEEKPFKEQLQKLLKEMLYSKRKSARAFYQSGYGMNNIYGGGFAAPREED